MRTIIFLLMYLNVNAGEIKGIQKHFCEVNKLPEDQCKKVFWGEEVQKTQTTNKRIFDAMEKSNKKGI